MKRSGVDGEPAECPLQRSAARKGTHTPKTPENGSEAHSGRRRARQKWRCPKCGWEYEPPIPTIDVRHKCTNGTRQKLTLIVESAAPERAK